jgi:hypothetical protein
VAPSKFGLVQPDWPAARPSRFLDNLQPTPDAVLVVYRTDGVRLGGERDVNRLDVRDWRFAHGKLWLHASDDRGDAPRPFDGSLDLGHVL